MSLRLRNVLLPCHGAFISLEEFGELWVLRWYELARGRKENLQRWVYFDLIFEALLGTTMPKIWIVGVRLKANRALLCHNSSSRTLCWENPTGSIFCDKSNQWAVIKSRTLQAEATPRTCLRAVFCKVDFDGIDSDSSGCMNGKLVNGCWQRLSGMRKSRITIYPIMSNAKKIMLRENVGERARHYSKTTLSKILLSELEFRVMHNLYIKGCRCRFWL
jgi:hypothetical protein